jgi:hypothetical protein
MKRRTNRKAAVNAVEHRLAFEHAVRVYGKMVKKERRPQKPTHSRSMRRIRFTVDLDLEQGGTIELEFSCTRGFRIAMLSSLWNVTLPTNPDAHRHCSRRLEAYRQKLHAWKVDSQSPLTFRHFNLLLAALSYHAATNP